MEISIKIIDDIARKRFLECPHIGRVKILFTLLREKNHMGVYPGEEATEFLGIN